MATRPTALRYAHIAGWGMDVPDRVMRNDDFIDLVKVGDDWIYPRTGIHERRVAATGETTTHLAVRAARQALDVAGVLPREVDFVVVATSTPEYIFPSTASMVQDALGAVNAGAHDLAAACAGFVYALDTAANKIRTGSINTALVIGAETMTRVLDWSDRKTCVLFGDGAGALVLRGSDEPGGVQHCLLRSDGTGWDLLTLPTVGSQETYLADGKHAMHKLTMDGRCVFQFATHALAEGLVQATEAVGITPHDLDLIVPHQANQRIIDAAAETLDLPREKFYSNLDRYGNTSAASIPIALCEAASSGGIQPGALVGVVGFGGGLTWGAAVIEWSGACPDAVRVVQWPRRHQQVIQASVRRFWLRHYWRWMVYHSPKATLRRWRRKMLAAASEAG
jgi:3-oxoacyl-[acyl-carrier-protein] synthase-3